MYFLKLILCLLLSVDSKTIDFGVITNRPSARIVGGHEVYPKYRFPWMVSLQYLIWNACGGTLYNERTVISAAHCVIGPIESWTAHVHRHNLTKTDQEEKANSYVVLERTMHPEYLTNDDNGNDVSVWILDVDSNLRTNVVFDSTDGYSFEEGLNLKVIGWGTVSKGGKYSDVLLETNVQVVSNAACAKVYKKLDTVSQFCAGVPEGGKDACQGDSGGPIFVEKGDTTILVGVVAWGEGCAKPGVPSVYTRTSAKSVRSFIDGFLKK